MTLKLGVVMDPIGSINFKKDSTLAMLLEAQQRGYTIYYFEQADLFMDGSRAMGHARKLGVRYDPVNWYELAEPHALPLAELDVILMRKDPPFDIDYIFSTYILEAAQQAGVLIVNDPRSLRDANEKLFALQFPQCIVPTIVTACSKTLKAFISEHADVIVKPLEGMGGQSIFRITTQDPNINVILETMTHRGKRLIMAQRFIPEISQGDKRILMIDGVAVPYALARIPGKGETRGNLAAGGRGEGVALSERDVWICEQVAPRLRAMGLMFVGLDVIGDYLTEINVTSPTCIRELDALYNLNISALLMDRIEERCHSHANAKKN
jgi:glutathione synthase